MNFPGALTQEDLENLLSSSLVDNLLTKAGILIEEAMHQGIISLPEQELFSAGSIEVWRWSDGTLEKEAYALEQVLTPDTLDTWLVEKLGDIESIPRLHTLFRAFVKENGFFDQDQTSKHRQKAAEQIEPILAKLVSGQIILRKGDIISAEASAQIRAVGAYSVSVNLSTIGGTIIYLLVIFALSVYVLSKRVLIVSLRLTQVVYLAGLSLIYLLISAVLVKIVHLPEGIPFSVILPTATISILVALVISTNVGYIFSLLLALLLLPVVKMDIYTFLFAVFSGIAGTAVAMNAEKRIDLIKAGVYLSLCNCFVLGGLSLIGNYRSGWFLPALGWGIVNGFAGGIISMGFLPVFEHWLNTATRFRLRELSDLNAPILKRMLSLAPGTYSHSISVANLAESAASEIKANALLARVGAYYHDIGKIEQAEYFIENQRSFNKHDELKPSLSAAVIKSHVKIGIEKARELSLPAEIIDIIAQHHGGSVIKYFYQRAVDNNQDKKIAAEDYSYHGNRPKSKEAAVVLLADTVEAASRTLKRPTIAKLEKFVWDIIMDKFMSNELKHSDLTLKDLEGIKKSFVQILAGYFHSRIEYPKNKKAAVERS